MSAIFVIAHQENTAKQASLSFITWLTLGYLRFYVIPWELAYISTVRESVVYTHTHRHSGRGYDFPGRITCNKVPTM